MGSLEWVLGFWSGLGRSGIGSSLCLRVGGGGVGREGGGGKRFSKGKRDFRVGFLGLRGGVGAGSGVGL